MLDHESLREYCIKKPGVTEGFPFGGETLVFKVMGKMFLLTTLDSLPVAFNVKCDPDKALELRDEYEAVIPGYHMSKKHWNTVTVDGTIEHRLLLEWIDESYALVAKSLKKKDREALAKL